MKVHNDSLIRLPMITYLYLLVFGRYLCHIQNDLFTTFQQFQWSRGWRCLSTIDLWNCHLPMIDIQKLLKKPNFTKILLTKKNYTTLAKETYNYPLKIYVTYKWYNSQCNKFDRNGVGRIPHIRMVHRKDVSEYMPTHVRTEALKASCHHESAQSTAIMRLHYFEKDGPLGRQLVERTLTCWKEITYRQGFHLGNNSLKSYTNPF